MECKPGTWVYKQDGSIQCQDAPGVSLDEMRRELEEIIGAKNVLNAESGTIAVTRECDTPTGNINAYEITSEGFSILTTGTVGDQGFKDLREVCDPVETSEMAQLGDPVLIEDLIGKESRVYQEGDALTEDYWPDRVNIELVGATIKKIWFG